MEYKNGLWFFPLSLAWIYAVYLFGSAMYRITEMIYKCPTGCHHAFTYYVLFFCIAILGILGFYHQLFEKDKD